jgi:hypothetical protein
VGSAVIDPLAAEGAAGYFVVARLKPGVKPRRPIAGGPIASQLEGAGDQSRRRRRRDAVRRAIFGSGITRSAMLARDPACCSLRA